MREILFRGQRIYNGEWVYGYLTKAHDFYTIQYEDNEGFYCEEKIIPKTVGQFTGLTDKNGKRIFEGDIVVTKFTNGDICCVGDVQFDCGVFGAEWTQHKKRKTMVGCFGQRHNLRRFDDDIINEMEVIGNIHDNPELLGD